MMLSSLPLLLLALVPAPTLTAPTPNSYDGYTQMVVPAKRAALVLDRLLIALQKALHDDSARSVGPRTSPRIGGLDGNDMMGGESTEMMAELPDLDAPRTAPLRIPAFADDTSSLQRRGQGTGRGRVLRCYFNAVTCF